MNGDRRQSAWSRHLCDGCARHARPSRRAAIRAEWPPPLRRLPSWCAPLKQPLVKPPSNSRCVLPLRKAGRPISTSGSGSSDPSQSGPPAAAARCNSIRKRKLHPNKTTQFVNAFYSLTFNWSLRSSLLPAGLCQKYVIYPKTKNKKKMSFIFYWMSSFHIWTDLQKATIRVSATPLCSPVLSCTRNWNCWLGKEHPAKNGHFFFFIYDRKVSITKVTIHSQAQCNDSHTTLYSSGPILNRDLRSKQGKGGTGDGFLLFSLHAWTWERLFAVHLAVAENHAMDACAFFPPFGTIQTMRISAIPVFSHGKIRFPFTTKDQKDKKMEYNSFRSLNTTGADTRSDKTEDQSTRQRASASPFFAMQL